MTETFVRAGITPPPLKTNARPWIICGLSLMLSVFALLGGWAATASISSAVIATGTITVDGKRKLLQHLEGGIVRRVLVRDGDEVKAGQVLVELDATRAKANLNIIQGSLSKELASEARLIAERDGADTVTYPRELAQGLDPAELAAIVESQNGIFRARRNAIAGQVSILKERIAQLAEESKGLEAQRQSKAHQLALIVEELTGLKHLLDMGQTTKTKVLSLERQAAELRGQQGELASAIARGQKNVGETQLEILQRDRDFQKSVTEELQRSQAQLRDLRERAVAAQDVLDRIRIVAPVGGTVVNVSVHTVGAVIKPGETIMEIVPMKNNLILEVAVRPQDIDNVTTGQAAMIRLLAFKQRSTPLLNGIVTYVSADVLESKATREQYYLAHIEASEKEIQRLGASKVQPGMQAEVMIKTGDRTTLQYIIQPITDSMNRAMREE